MSRKFQQCKRNTELSVPPDKKRKTDLNMPPHCQTNDAGEELWDDDDDMDVFTQDQLENIDNLIASSQQVGTGRPLDGGTVQSIGSQGRLVGHGSTKSRSMGEPWSSHVSSFCDARNPSQAQWTRRNSASKLTSQSSYTKTAYQTTKSNHISSISRISATGLPPKNTTQHKDLHACSPPTSSTTYPTGGRSTAPIGHTLKQQSFSPSVVDTGSEKLSQVLPSNEAQLDNMTRQQVDKLLLECENYRKEMALLRQNQQSNDGQVKILRASLTQKENELSRLRQEQLRVVEQDARLKEQLELNLGKEIDKLKTQLQFKEQEIIEVQARCKKLDARLAKVGNDELESGSSLLPQSPRSKVGNLLTSPKSKVTCLSSTKSKVMVTSPTKGAFPNEHSFLSEEKSPRAGRSSQQDSTKKGPIGNDHPQRRRQRMVLRGDSKDTPVGPLLVDRLISPCGADSPGSASHVVPLPSGLLDLMQISPHLSHPTQVTALQCLSPHKGSSVATNKYASSAGVGQMAPLVTNSDHLSLARQALHELLSRLHLPGTNVQNVSACSCSDTQSALLFLPLVEDGVDSFIASMDGKSESAFSSPATSLVASVSDSSVESMSGSLRALSVAPLAGCHRNSAVGCVLNALGMLNTLVNCSAHVRHAIVCHVTSHATSTQKGKMEEPCCHGNSMVDLDPRLGKYGDCQLFKKLINLANPLHFQHRPCCVEVTEMALVCLTSLAHNCHQQHLHRFESLVSQDVLVNCLTDDLDVCVQSRCALAMHALDILTALVQSSLLLSLLCVCADECLLQLVYACGCSDWKGRTTSDTTRLSLKVVTLLSTIVSHHKNGVTLLLTPNCQCGADVVKSVVQILHRELHVYRASPSAGSLRLLRDGIALLHAFSVRDMYYRRHHQDVEHQYVQLVCGTEMLFRETDGIGDHEMAALLELWDFDQDCPNGSSEEDDEENKAPGPVTGDAKDRQGREEQPMDVIEVE